MTVHVSVLEGLNFPGDDIGAYAVAVVIQLQVCLLCVCVCVCVCVYLRDKHKLTYIQRS